jgi:hypothetical protein
MTILIADLAADCFKVIPRKAPSSERSAIPARIDTGTEEVSVIKTNGSSKASEAREEVIEVTSPDSKALRWTLDNIS